MTERDVIAHAFDARASSYDESAMHRHVAEAVAAFVDLTAVKDVLDVATGTALVLRCTSFRTSPPPSPSGGGCFVPGAGWSLRLSP